MNMNITTGLDPFSNPIDRILAQIAYSIQLPPSLHAKAVSRYEAVRKHLEGTAAFAGLIEHFYPQGSMAIDATISTRGTDDEYDIDIIAQLGGHFRDLGPLHVLTSLERALSGYRGLKVTRQTRCVTVHYTGMHLDISPSIRDYGHPDRQSRIMHARGPESRSDDCHVPTNAFAFCEWYKEMTPDETLVMEAFQKRWLGDTRFRAEAEVDDVPDQTHFGVKNMATLALQLIKRYRNIRYSHPARTGRMPPSVLLAYYAARTSRRGHGLAQTLVNLCKYMAFEITQATNSGRMLHVENPKYGHDVFTDRWPDNLAQQNLFATDLHELVRGLENLMSGNVRLVDAPDWLRGVFGSHVVTNAIELITREDGVAIQESRQSYTTSGGVLIGAAALSTPAVAKTPSIVKPSNHTFFGDAS